MIKKGIFFLAVIVFMQAVAIFAEQPMMKPAEDADADQKDFSAKKCDRVRVNDWRRRTGRSGVERTANLK